jgi:hypothetical protein
LQLQPVIDHNSNQNLQIPTDQYNNQQQQNQLTTFCVFFTNQPKVANFVSTSSWKKNFHENLVWSLIVAQEFFAIAFMGEGSIS